MKISRFLAQTVLVASFALDASAQTAKRLVLIKVDGLPADLLERYLDRTDANTGRYLLPWIRHVFVERGTDVENFYVRGISLSAPSWSMLDTGRHLAIRGNAEFDRYYPRVYDYLNFFPFYVGYARSHLADMPGVEVLDECGIPLLIDQFPVEARYQGMQLFQRGVRWKTLSASLASWITRPVREIVDEWQMGFDFSDAIMQQQERELIQKLADPRILYLDYYSGDFDHTAHLTNDETAQVNELRRIDATIGRIWTAVGASPLARETVVALLSDHGMNSTPGVYSQGYNLVRFFNSAEGGGHHVITDRHPLDQYKLRGLDPFVSSVVTPSAESAYLTDQKDYPTALLDLDGNERASVQFRNNDLNEIQILLQQVARPVADKARREAEAAAILAIVDRHREAWSAEAAEINEELAALGRAIEKQRALVAADTHGAPKEDEVSGQGQDASRRLMTLDDWQRNERGYSEYVRALERLLNLKQADLVPLHIRAEGLIPKAVMGEPNSPGQLQRYVSGPAKDGMAFRPDGSLDEERSFLRVNYFAALTGIHVRNSVQPALGSSPVDFIATRVAKRALRNALSESDLPDSDAIFLYRDPADEALLLSRHQSGELWIRYLPINGAEQDRDGAMHFSPAPWRAGEPLNLFEDAELRVPGDRASWLNSWHSEREWFQATHRTRYSNAVIGLNEYFRSWEPDAVPPVFKIAAEEDWPALRRFAVRLRRAVEPDLLVMANSGWNFNVRSFNPGGNHGSFFRISTHSVFMLAGAGVPPGLRVEPPYDSLNVVPTLLALLGRPVDSYPAPPVTEIVGERRAARY